MSHALMSHALMPQIMTPQTMSFLAISETLSARRASAGY
jgi:hypothetical protein